MDQKEETLGSEEQMRKLFDLVEDMPPISLSRNDLCPCGSNKKYKKCCLDKDQRHFAPTKLKLQSFTITYGPLTPEESQNDFPPIADEDERIMASLYHTLMKHPDMLEADSDDFFRQLNAMRTKYPNNPIILNYITSGYQILKQQDKADALIDETYERFPNYLFAQIAVANKFLRADDPDKAIQVFKGAYTLQSLYPNRTVFHISEARAFFYFMVEYFCMKEDVKQAEIYLQALEKVLEADDLAVQQAQMRVREAKEIQNLETGMFRILRQAFKGHSFNNH